MELDKGYVYFGSSDDLEDVNQTKIGMCNNTVNRLNTYDITYPGYKLIPYIIIKCISNDEAAEISLLLHRHFKKYSMLYLHEYTTSTGPGCFNKSKDWFDTTFDKDAIHTFLEAYTYDYTLLEDVELAHFITKEHQCCHLNNKAYYNKYKGSVGRPIKHNLE